MTDFERCLLYMCSLISVVWFIALVIYRIELDTIGKALDKLLRRELESKKK